MINKLIKKITYRSSRMIREYYYSRFPNKELMSILKSKLVWGLTLETCNICNANCVFCAYQYQKRKKCIMANDLFKEIIHNYVSIGGGDLRLCSLVGDPLLDPNFIDHVKFARQFINIKAISTVTNIINLHNIGVEKLLTSGINEINISTSGFDYEMHERIYRSNKFSYMKDNLINILRSNDKLGRPVKISISLRIDKKLTEVLKDNDFREIQRLADSVVANYFFDDWGGRINSAELPQGMKIRPRIFQFLRKRNPCSMLYGSLAVLSNGTATLCGCRDLNGDSELVLGDVRKKSLNDLYNSEYSNKLRSDWLSGKKIPDICKNCTHYSSFAFNMLKEVRSNIDY